MEWRHLTTTAPKDCRRGARGIITITKGSITKKKPPWETITVPRGATGTVPTVASYLYPTSWEGGPAVHTRRGSVLAQHQRPQGTKQGFSAGIRRGLYAYCGTQAQVQGHFILISGRHELTLQSSPDLLYPSRVCLSVLIEPYQTLSYQVLTH
jgi:hypothetical protein